MQSRFGRYEITRPLGRGGFGAVYEAVMHGPGGLRLPVALKVLHRGDGLRREARIGGLLRHRHIVDVYEVGEVDGTWFCAMELCRGGTLAALAPLDPRAVVEVGLAICDALSYAWSELGLVHLDLKPDNLLLSGTVPKLADLGLARARGFEGDGKVRGTAGFMAPEQLRGRAVDTRTDVWALGATLSWLARGGVPEAGTTTFDDDDHDAADSRSAPDWLAPVVDLCQADHADDRPADFGEVATLLRALRTSGRSLVAHLGSPEPPQSPPDLLPEEEGQTRGRGALIGALVDALDRPGPVALHGAPGVGKSRVAREVARAWRRRPGVALRVVDLVPARTGAEARVRVGHALGAPPTSAGIAAALRELGTALLVLDPVEHLPAAALVAELCGGAPELRVLVVGRTPGPTSTEVPPLSATDGVRLLGDRAMARGVVTADPATLQGLSAALGGLPLLLELAAGRFGVLSPEEVLERLGPALLRSGREGDREATLQGALDWSFRLLAPAEQAALAELSVFRDGFSLEAAEAVLTPGPRSTLDLLGALADAGFLARAPGAGPATVTTARFGLLAPIAAYAATKLTDPEVAVRHARFYAAPGQVDRARESSLFRDVRALVPDLQNCVAAAERALAKGDAALACDAASAAWSVWSQLGPPEPGLALAEALLALPVAPAAVRLRAASIAGQACQLAGDTEGAATWFRRSAELAAEAGDRAGEGAAFANLAGVHRWMQRWDESERASEAAIRCFREVGDHRREAMVTSNLSQCALHRGDLRRARALLETATQADVSPYVSAVLATQRSHLAEVEGDLAGALSLLDAPIAWFFDSGDRVNAALALTQAGKLCGRLERAGEQWGRFAQARTLLREARVSNVTAGYLDQWFLDHPDPPG